MKVKKKKKSRLAVVFLCVAAVFALLWGGAELLRHLTHYGENATVGTQEQPIYESFTELLDDAAAYEKMSRTANPYGDGRIVAVE